MHISRDDEPKDLTLFFFAREIVTLSWLLPSASDEEVHYQDSGVAIFIPFKKAP